MILCSWRVAPWSRCCQHPLYCCCCCPAGIYGALYCLADVHTEFSEVAKQLKEVAELLGLGLNRQLGGPLLHEYLVSAVTLALYTSLA